MKSCSETSDDMLWEYDGLHDAYQGECEEILLEMQKIFYDDLKSEQNGKGKVWLGISLRFFRIPKIVVFFCFLR